MSSTENEIPESLSIDVDQWRREIRMFAESTEKAIDVIVSDLSSSTARSGSAGMTGKSSPSQARSASDNGGSERLAELRAQIAKRLQQP